MATIAPTALYMIMAGMLIAGTFNTIILKLQNGMSTSFEEPPTDVVDDDGNEMRDFEEFNHPFFQGLIMFLGELTCMAVYRLMLWKEKKALGGDLSRSPALKEAQEQGLKTSINPFLLAIPAMCDLCASTLMFVALTMVAASVYQMMRGLIVFITAMMSIIFLKKRLHRHHWTALVLIIGGIVLVGVASLSGDSGDTKALGIILLIVSQLMAGTMFIVEEKLLGDYYLHPLKVVGWEGFWGVLMYLILLTVFQFIPCHGDFSSGWCPPPRGGLFENSIFAFHQMFNNIWIFVLSLGTICSIACFNSFGIATTKYGSAAQRATIDTSRTVLIWLFFLIVPTSSKEEFSFVQLGGFILLVIGTLLYNEIVVLPILGFGNNTAAAKSRRLKGD